MTADDDWVPTEEEVRHYTRAWFTESDMDRFLAHVRRDAARDAMEDADYWQARAYEAEGKLWKAEARIRAVRDVLGKHEAILGDNLGVPVKRIRRALDGA